MTNSDLQTAIESAHRRLMRTPEQNRMFDEIKNSYLYFIAEQNRRLTEQKEFTPRDLLSGKTFPPISKPRENAEYRYTGPNCVISTNDGGRPLWRFILYGQLSRDCYACEHHAIEALKNTLEKLHP